jgi:hypothetical protein
MPFLGAVNVDGDSKELLGRYDQVMNTLRRAENPPPGLISHYCMETDRGIRVVNCYDTEQQTRAHYEAPEFQDALRKAGMQPLSPQIMRVHNYFHVNR